MVSSICCRIALFVTQSFGLGCSPVHATELIQMENNMGQLTLSSKINPDLLNQQFWLKKCQTDEDRNLLNRIFNKKSADLKTEFLTKFATLIDGYFIEDSYLIPLMLVFHKLPKHLHKDFTQIMQKAPFFLDPPLSDGRLFFELAKTLSQIDQSHWVFFKECLEIFREYDLFFGIPVVTNSAFETLTFVNFLNELLGQSFNYIPKYRSHKDLYNNDLRIILKRNKKGRASDILNAIYAYMRTPKNELTYEEQEINKYVYDLFSNNTDINAHDNLEELAQENGIPLSYFEKAHAYFLKKSGQNFIQNSSKGSTTSDLEAYLKLKFIPPSLFFKNNEKIIKDIIHKIYLSTDNKNRRRSINNFIERHPSIPRRQFIECIRQYENEVADYAEKYFYELCKLKPLTPEHILNIHDKEEWDKKYASNPKKMLVINFIKTKTFFFSGGNALEYFLHLMSLHINTRENDFLA